MNETNNSRLSRIKKVSRVFRYFILANLIFNIAFWLIFFPIPKNEHNLRGALVGASGLLMLFWFWKLAQLFRLYERGLIFVRETIRCIRVLGIICVMGWMILMATRFTPRTEPPPQEPLSPKVKLVSVEKHTYHMGFLSFDFGTGFDFGLLFVGATVVLTAWIMDEGRKIQEEQELTI
jgi:hypothetical protein